MYVRQKVAEYLREYSKNLDAEIKDRRESHQAHGA